jgi:class 3 adenylate cyclase
MSTEFRMIATAAVLVGVLGLAAAPVPAMRELEDTLVLPSFFYIRGPIAPPKRVAIATMDEGSAAALGFGMPQREWPRSVHATLVSRLVELGAAAIAFDVQFLRASAAASDDALFAEAIRKSRRVVLVERVDALRVGATQVWEQQQPIPVLNDAAVSSAPAPLPDIPVVSWTWLHLPTPRGDVPTLPVAALRAAAATETDAATRWALVLKSLPNIPRIAYLNFYGPPGSICSVSYAAIVKRPASEQCDMRGAIVFVGGGHSNVDRSDVPDSYHTAYPSSDGVDFTGVELQATALANLVDGMSLEVLGSSFIVVFLWGAALAWAGHAIRSGRARRIGSSRVTAAICVSLAGVAYFAAAYVCFARFHLLIPVTIPVVVQAPTALILALVLRPRPRGETVPVVCLATDATGSTELGQRLPHDTYARLMRNYIAGLSAAVKARSGDVLDPEGDGFVAVWRCPDASTSIRLNACLAALDILDAAESFEKSAPDGIPLPTRVAVTMGVVTLHSDADRGTFEAHGDAVNLAARLRDLNTVLGTRCLASAAVVEGLQGELLVRPLPHNHPIKGVAEPPPIVEVARSPSGVVSGTASANVRRA